MKGTLSYYLGEVAKERKRQDDQWGEQNHKPLRWLAILMEEVGEVSKAILEKDALGYRDELVHVAAVSVAALQSFAHGRRVGGDEERAGE